MKAPSNHPFSGCIDRYAFDDDHVDRKIDSPGESHCTDKDLVIVIAKQALGPVIWCHLIAVFSVMAMNCCQGPQDLYNDQNRINPWIDQPSGMSPLLDNSVALQSPTKQTYSNSCFIRWIVRAMELLSMGPHHTS